MAELNLPFFGHGGDYNPDQWRDTPEILKEDIRLMKLAGCNLMSVGIFSWAALEPEEGHYDFGWLQDVLDRFAANGIYAFLATPSGARPAWMSAKYPEVLRVQDNGLRNFHGERHNHCYTSPIYREFVRKMNTALAERFGHHPAVVGWHISNEYGGECHCELCQNAFRDFLKQQYGTLDNLNHQWWTGFWAKRYTDWSQLHSPSKIGERNLHGLNLSWRRFVTHQTADFMRAECEPLRKITPHLPVTTNMMFNYDGLDYHRLSDEMDFASFDCYPRWNGNTDEDQALQAAFNYDWMRSLLKKPFALMESTPSQVNWHEICKLKRPGMHLLSSMQAVAHGADTVQYFQWRKSRGSGEKFHGAVVDHVGHENTRTFRDVAEVGEALQKMQDVLHSGTHAEVALIYDTENRWAIDDSQGPRRNMEYIEQVQEYYRGLARSGVNIDVIDQLCDFNGYKIIVAPMLYMVKPGVAERLQTFAANGGTVVFGCHSGCVDQDDLCFLGGFPGPLRKLAGVWIEEVDALYDGESNGIRMHDGKTYSCGFTCDLMHTETAETLGEYTDDFYAGMPAVTVNHFGSGCAYVVASRPDEAFLDDFLADCLKKANVQPIIPHLPIGVQVTLRENETGRYLFVMNFSNKLAQIDLPQSTNILTDACVCGTTDLAINAVLILKLKEEK